jgi:hypothetical protein
LAFVSPFIVHRLRAGKGSSAINTHAPHGGTTRRPARSEIDKTSKKWVSEKEISVMTIAEDARDYICSCPSVVNSVISVLVASEHNPPNNPEDHMSVIATASSLDAVVQEYAFPDVHTH